MLSIPFIRIVAKDNYDLGLQIGKRLKKNIHRRLATTKQVYQKIGMKNFANLCAHAQKFVPATNAHFPELIAELQGMSRAAAVPFEKLMVLMCEEELLDIKDIAISHCTNVAVKTKNAILVGHNEDWLNSYRHNGLFVLQYTMGDRRSLSLNYIGSLAASCCGLNAQGLCFTANSLNPGRFRYGVPVKFQLRAMLDCKTPQEAIYSDLEASSICSNTIYGWENTGILDVEDFFGHHEVFHRKKVLVHTNHPLLRKDRNPNNTPKESVARYERAVQLLGNSREHTLEDVKEILRDHTTRICGHAKRHSSWGSTIASVIMNPKEKWMEVCGGNPCTHTYTRYTLRV